MKFSSNSFEYPCITAPGLEGPFTQLIVKNATTLFLVRKGKVPLKTVDGGSTWAPMASLAALQGWPWLKLEGKLSWSGNTLVVYGVDPTAARLRQAYGAFIWKSADDGETWTDETGDLATLSIGHGRWYESDFYLVTQGQGVIVKRNFE